eukprot:TRINITY_DN79418_c0_g1_i1.p1 TRINITY_DN79418_c0_g1~~TRINITY_DN79418_c0_g1_i1.p1  ORF type:complete len:213 (-),score=58.26 TRINITY_DN79418_c0_g1_i1:103-741(-)
MSKKTQSAAPRPDEARDEQGGLIHRIVVLGSGGVGKSALVIRYVTQNFVDEYDPTIEDCYKKNVMIDGNPATLEIVDTAGQEGFGTLVDQWILRGNAFLLIYSITSKQSFHALEKLHDQILTVKESDDAPIALVGNKCDLEDQRQVQTSEGKELADQWKCLFFETSAKEKINDETVFVEIVRVLRKKTPELAAPVAAGSPKPTKSRGFCNIL